MMKSSKKTLLYLTAAFLFLFVLLVRSPGAKQVSADGHEHKVIDWSANAEYHWHYCEGDGFCPEAGILDYAPHDFKGGHICWYCRYDTKTGYRADTWITMLNWYMYPPAGGDYIGLPLSLDEAPQAQLEMFSWSPAVPGGMNGIFAYNTVYTLTITLDAMPYYYFAPGIYPGCTINGNKAEFIYVNPSSAQIRYTFPATQPEPAPSLQNFTIPVIMNVSGAAANTPDPGNNVFHFNIWSDSGVPITINNNAVSANGFGQSTGSLSISVPSGQDTQQFISSRLHVQQYDGNPDWNFDMTVFDMFYSAEYNEFRTLPAGVTNPENHVNYLTVNNVYKAAAPTAPTTAPDTPSPTQPPTTAPSSSAPETVPEKITVKASEDEVSITIPVKVVVEKGGTDPVPPAVFHFGLGGMQKDQKYTFTDDVVNTAGEGTFTGSISFTVPTGSQLDKLLQTGFDVRERSAVVNGWRFPSEVYHVDLEKDGDTITTVLRGFRNTSQEPSELVFVNRYTLSSGNETEVPSSMLGVEDLIEEALSLENGLYRSTMNFALDGEVFSVSWEARKSGDNIGNVNATFRYTPEGGSEKAVGVGDILRVTPEGIWIKANLLADVYRQLTGKDVYFVEDIPEGDWLSFVRSDSSIFDTEKLDEFIRTVVHDLGPVFDRLPTAKIAGGYHTAADENACLSAQNALYGYTCLNHTDWYTLDSAAAADPELKTLAKDIDDNFSEFISQGLTPAGEFYLFFRGPDHTILVKEYELTARKTGENNYVFNDRTVSGVGPRTYNEDSIIVVEPADALQISAPESSESGYPLLKKLLLDLLKGKELFRILDEDEDDDEAEENYVYDFDSYRFVLPEFYRGKVTVKTTGESLSLFYKDYYVVGIHVYGPDDEYTGGDPMTGFDLIGTATNKNSVAVAFDSALPRVVGSEGNLYYLGLSYPGITAADLDELLYLQTGKHYDMDTIGEMDHFLSYGESSYCITLMEENITLK